MPKTGNRRLSLPKGEETALPDWVDDQKWAWAPEGRVRVPDGEAVEAPRLQVHIGNWPTGWHEEAKQQAVRQQLRLYRSRPRSGAGIEEKWVRKDRLQTARRVEREVAPKTHWSGPEGLRAILESGEFQVTGTVYFRPLRPFQPDPKIPASREQARKKLMSFQAIGGRRDVGFRYPEDAL